MISKVKQTGIVRKKVAINMVSIIGGGSIGCADWELSAGGKMKPGNEDMGFCEAKSLDQSRAVII